MERLNQSCEEAVHFKAKLAMFSKGAALSLRWLLGLEGLTRLPNYV